MNYLQQMQDAGSVINIEAALIAAAAALLAGLVIVVWRHGKRTSK